MNIISKSLSNIITLLSCIVFLCSSSVLGNTLLGMPSSHGCHNEKSITMHEDRHSYTAVENEHPSCCDTGLCPSGICCAYSMPGTLDIKHMHSNQITYTQKEKIFGFSIISQSILEPPGWKNKS